MTSSSILNTFATNKPKKRFKSINKDTEQEGALDLDNDTSRGLKDSPDDELAPKTVPIGSRGPTSVRLLIFLEDSDGTRSVIFDSGKFGPRKNESKRPFEAPLNTAISNNLNKKSLSSSKLNTEMITRMVFGSFPMKVSNNVAIKVHALRNSNKSMISNVFTYYNTEKRDMNQEACECLTKDQSDENQKTIVKEDSISIVRPPSALATTANSKPIDITNTYSFQKSHAHQNSSSSTERINMASSESCSLNSPDLSTTHPKSRLNSNSMNSYSTNSTLNNTTCSSVPASYESFATIYKRLMRSLSNSLISENADVPKNSPVSVTSSFRKLQLTNTETPPGGSSINPQPLICQKCIEDNCYPKYKIGVAAIYSPRIVDPYENEPNKSKQAVLDPLTFFPSVPSSAVPSSVSSSPSSQNMASGSSPGSNDSGINNDINEDFYEFFFSHLPLIEYQFKELRQRVIAFLPAYFASNPKYRKPKSPNQFLVRQMGGSAVSSHRNSISSGTSVGDNMNRSSTSLHSLPNPTSPPTSSISSFSRLVLNELRLFESKFNLLYSAPRLTSPAWLSISSSRDEAMNISNRLMNELVYLRKNLLSSSFKISQSGGARATNRLFDLNMKKFWFYSRASKESPQTNRDSDDDEEKSKQFMSTILSTVLKHHLSWIFTVQPTSCRGDTSSSLRKHEPAWTRLLERLNPYNSLWAQLSDLHGSVNHPLRLVRTVVVGQNSDLVERILFVLSYFIRCGDSSYFDVVQDEFDFEKLDQMHSHKTEATAKIAVSELKFDPMTQLNSVILNSVQSPTSETASRRFTSSYSSSSSSSSSSFQSPFATDSPRTANKPRRISSNSNGFNCHAQELPLIGCQMKRDVGKSKRMHNNFGYSLLAAYTPEFLFEFVLHGTSDRSFLNTLNQRLKFSKNHSILDCPIDESIYIVVDVDNFEVKVFSSEREKPEIEKPVTMIDSMFESLISMLKLFKSNEFALLHLEDKLQEFYSKSVTLSKIKSQSADLNESAILDIIGLNDSRDLEFLNNIVAALTIPSF